MAYGAGVRVHDGRAKVASIMTGTQAESSHVDARRKPIVNWKWRVIVKGYHFSW